MPQHAGHGLPGPSVERQGSVMVVVLFAVWHVNSLLVCESAVEEDPACSCSTLMFGTVSSDSLISLPKFQFTHVVFVSFHDSQSSNCIFSHNLPRL
jgi:hypothetical protein